MKTPAKSPGHICFAGPFEFFAREGEVYRARVADPLADAVRVADRRVASRHGRWECSQPHFDRFRAAILEGL